MIQKALSGTGMEFSPCQHEFDKEKLPEWDKHFGRVYTCSKCGERLVGSLKSVPKGVKVRCSKKDRRRLKKLEIAAKEFMDESV